MYELYLRWKEPMNTFWRRMMHVLGALGTLCAFVTDFLPNILHDDMVPEEWKAYLRPVYSALLFGAVLAKLTAKDTTPIEFHKKIKEAKKTT